MRAAQELRVLPGAVVDSRASLLGNLALALDLVATWAPLASKAATRPAGASQAWAEQALTPSLSLPPSLKGP